MFSCSTRGALRSSILEPFANSQAREITEGDVDRAAAMCQSGERRSLIARRSGEIDRPCSGHHWPRAGERRGKGKYSASYSATADKLSGGPPQTDKGSSRVTLDRRGERSAARLPYTHDR